MITLSKPNSSTTLARNLHLLFNGSTITNDRSGRTIFKGKPGKPAPLPTSAILISLAQKEAQII